MKYDCDKRNDRLSNWHRWFAWHPVKIEKNDGRWFEYVERKGDYACGWKWEYRV